MLCRKWVWRSWSVSTWNVNQWLVLPRCLTLSADAASDQACCRRYVCLSTRQHSISSCKDTIKQLQQETPDLICLDLWPPNSPDLNPAENKVWGFVQQIVYECHMNSVSELKLRLVEVWNSLQQNVIDVAIEWRKWLRACMRADGQHFEHLLRAHVTGKTYGQIKYK